MCFHIRYLQYFQHHFTFSDTTNIRSKNRWWSGRVGGLWWWLWWIVKWNIFSSVKLISIQFKITLHIAERTINQLHCCILLGRLFNHWLLLYPNRKLIVRYCVGISLWTDEKENEIFLIYKEIQFRGIGCKVMTKGFLTQSEKFAHFLIYWEALPYIWLCTRSHLNFLIYEENLVLVFISV